MNTAVQLYALAVQCKGRIRSSGWWSPWYVHQLRKDRAELFRLFRALPEPRFPRADRMMRLVLQALGSQLCGFRHDKARITHLFFALHNLPRAYLPEGHSMRLSEDQALKYATDWLEKAGIKLDEPQISPNE